MRIPTFKNGVVSRLAVATIAAAAVIALPLAAQPAGAAPAFPNFGSSGSADSGPIVGEERVARTLKWDFPGGGSGGTTWEASVSPDDRSDQAGWGRQCVNDRTGGFAFKQNVASGQTYSRSDELWMLASYSFPICVMKESFQSWVVELKATSADGRYIRTWRSRIDYRFIGGNLRVYIIGQSSPPLDIAQVGSELRIAPPF